MFNISFAELIVILLLGALILGPEEIGAVARFCGKAVRKSRGLLGEIKSYVNADEDEAINEMKTVADEINEVKDSLNPQTIFNDSAADLNINQTNRNTTQKKA